MRAAVDEVADYRNAVDQVAVTALRSVLGALDLQQALVSRGLVLERLAGFLHTAAAPWGLRIDAVELSKIEPWTGSDQLP